MTQTKKIYSKENKDGRVTCVLPNYNHAQFLQESLGGVLNQTRSFDKIIIIDDASTDHSLEVIKKITHDHLYVQIVTHKKNIGCVTSLNEGLHMSKTEFVVFPGADDRLDFDYLEKYLSLIQQWPEAAFCSGSGNILNYDSKIIGHRPLFMPAKEPRYINPQEVYELLKTKDNFFLAQTAIYRRKYLMELGGLNSSINFFSDGMMMRHLALKHGFCFMPKSLVSWRFIGDNQSVKNIVDISYLEDLVRNTRIYISKQPVGLFPKNYPDLLERRLRFGSARLQILMMPSITKKSIITLRKTLRLSAKEKYLYEILSKCPLIIAKIFLIVYVLLITKPFSFGSLVKTFLKRLLHYFTK